MTLRLLAVCGLTTALMLTGFWFFGPGPHQLGHSSPLIRP